MGATERESARDFKNSYGYLRPSRRACAEDCGLASTMAKYCLGYYNKEAHAGLAQMYVDDQRFTVYYDQIQPGAARFLRETILIYTGTKK